MTAFSGNIHTNDDSNGQIVRAGKQSLFFHYVFLLFFFNVEYCFILNRYLLRTQTSSVDQSAIIAWKEELNMNESRSDFKKKRIWKRVLLISLLGILVAAGGLMWGAYNDVDSTMNAVFNAVDTRDKREDEVSFSETQPISFALLGIDSYGDELEEMGGRSDTIIIVTINPETKQTTLVSIPRDSYTEMVDYQTDIYNEYNDKITHAYAFGGTEMALNSIQEFLNIPIDYYVEINMYGLADLVDAIGGIEITSPLTFDYNDAYFVEGETVTLQGWDALAFARMRYDDPQGDTGRQLRQQMVIKAIVDKLLSIEGISNYQDILTAVETNMRTNLTFENLIDIQKNYSDSITEYSQLNIAGEEMYMEDIYYNYVHPEERLRISNLLRDELELEQVTLDDMNLSDADIQYGYGDSNSPGNEVTLEEDSNNSY